MWVNNNFPVVDIFFHLSFIQTLKRILLGIIKVHKNSYWPDVAFFIHFISKGFRSSEVIILSDRIKLPLVQTLLNHVNLKFRVNHIYRTQKFLDRDACQYFVFSNSQAEDFFILINDTHEIYFFDVNSVEFIIFVEINEEFISVLAPTIWCNQKNPSQVVLLLQGYKDFNFDKHLVSIAS